MSVGMMRNRRRAKCYVSHHHVPTWQLLKYSGADTGENMFPHSEKDGTNYLRAESCHTIVLDQVRWE